jgi:hypothetical protein
MFFTWDQKIRPPYQVARISIRTYWKNPNYGKGRSNEEPEELIRYAALIHNSVMTATSTEQWETSCLVNDAFGTTSWLF